MMVSNIFCIVTSVLAVVATAAIPRKPAQRTSTRTSSAVSTSLRTVASSLSTVASSSAASSVAASASAAATTINTNVQSTILIIARDAYSVSVASSGLNGYGIPFQTLLVPQAGVALPTLNSSTGGNFGGIIVAAQVSYDYGGTTGFQSALTADQWNILYAYQLAYGVRMVQYDVYPGPLFGASALGGCCDTGVEQLISFNDTSAFSQSGIKTGAGVSTQGLYHYPAQVTNSSSTTAIAQFAAGSGFGISTAAVINNFIGRQQMVFFIGWATDWSATSNFLQHAYITWMTRGLYAGYRRVNMNTQIDDMFLSTGLYTPAPAGSTEYRVVPNDLTSIANWVSTLQAKMNPGSFYLPETGHNGNGNVEASDNLNDAQCSPGPIEYDEIPDTPLEFQKPLGSGQNFWPNTPTTYQISSRCVQLDALEKWFQTTSNRDSFMHITHTHTHLELNNATYSDASKEISFNQAWFKQVGIANAKYFTSDGLIPPAITGLHNGDVLKAWTDNGLTHCVGDNTRPPLRNQQNTMWPYTTTVAADGFAGYNVIPRWATRIYYNCDTPNCTTQEWIDTSAGSGGFQDLLNVERSDTMRHFFGLYREGYMFHQANLRKGTTTVSGVSGAVSIFQAWCETIVQEFVRLVNWPMVTLKQADLAKQFLARQQRDACGYKMSWTVSNNKITAVQMTANSNTCGSAVPLTVPGTTTSTTGATTEKVGNDPTTLWVTLSGAARSYTLSTPLAL